MTKTEKRGELLEQDNFSFDEAKFIEALREAYDHWRTNDAFNNAVERWEGAPKDKSDISSIEDVKRIPVMPMNHFKRAPEKMAINPEEVVDYRFTSGTSSGEQGKRPMSEKGIEIASQNFKNITSALYPEFEDAALMIPDIENSEASKQATNRSFFLYTTWGLEQFDPEYFLEINKKGEPAPDIEGALDYLNGSEGTSVLFTPPPILHAANGYLKEQAMSLDLGEDTYLVTGGGWRGQEAMSLDDLREETEETLGIPEENMSDVYALTEVNSYLANKPGDQDLDEKRVPAQLFVYTANPEALKDRETEPTDGEGVLVAVDPLAHDAPGAIVTDDIVEKTGREYGEDTRIKYIGRAGSLGEEGDLRTSCGTDMAVEY